MKLYKNSIKKLRNSEFKFEPFYSLYYLNYKNLNASN